MNSHPTRRARRKARKRATLSSVLGEVLISAGAVVLLYVVWQMWVGDLILGAQNVAAGNSQVQEWAEAADEDLPAPVEVIPEDGSPAYYEPPVMAEPASGELFAVMRIPRLGDNFKYEIRSGTTASESLNIGAIGYYKGTQMPGMVGNFATAGHRGSHGGPYMYLPSLQPGDAIVVETQEGWYTYRFRNLEYVTPQAGDVLLPVPQEPEITGQGRYLTMTTCSPRYGWDERMIAYATYESFTPRQIGEPASLDSVAS